MNVHRYIYVSLRHTGNAYTYQHHLPSLSKSRSVDWININALATDHLFLCLLAPDFHLYIQNNCSNDVILTVLPQSNTNRKLHLIFLYASKKTGLLSLVVSAT